MRSRGVPGWLIEAAVLTGFLAALAWLGGSGLLIRIAETLAPLH